MPTVPGSNIGVPIVVKFGFPMVGYGNSYSYGPDLSETEPIEIRHFDRSMKRQQICMFDSVFYLQVCILYLATFALFR